MARLKPRLLTRVAAKVGLISRTKVLSNAVRYCILEVSQSIESGQKDVDWALRKIEPWFTDKLVERIDLHFYTERRICCRVVINIDWDEHDSEIAFNISVFEEDGDEEKAIYTSISGVSGQIRKRIEELSKCSKIDDLTCTVQISDYAENKYGVDRARELAEVVPLSDEDEKHVRSFAATNSLKIDLDRVGELGMGYQEGTSSKRPSNG